MCDTTNSYYLQVICRELGFANSNAIALQNSTSDVDVPISIVEVSCIGIEESLQDCHYVKATESSVKCEHKQDLFVKCLLTDKCNKLATEYPLRVSPMDSNVPVGMICLLIFTYCKQQQ